MRIIRKDLEALPTDGMITLTFGHPFGYLSPLLDEDKNISVSLAEITINTVTEDELEGGEKGWVSLYLEQVESYTSFLEPDEKEGYLGEFILYKGERERYPETRPEPEFDISSITYTGLSTLIFEETQFFVPVEAELAFVRIWRNLELTEIYTQFWLYNSEETHLLPQPAASCNVHFELKKKRSSSEKYMIYRGTYKGITEFHKAIPNIAKLRLVEVESESSENHSVQEFTPFTDELFLANNLQDNVLRITVDERSQVYEVRVPQWVDVIRVRTQLSPDKQELLVEYSFIRQFGLTG